MRTLFLLCFLQITTLAWAQTPAIDLLYKLDRSTVKVKISEINETQVFYTDLGMPATPRSIRKAELWKVVFSDGTADVYNQPTSVGSGSSITKEPARPKPVNKPTPVYVESYDGPQAIIKYAPLSSLGYEHVLSPKNSIYAGLSLYSLGFGITALGLKGEYRFYGLIKSSAKQVPEGFWVAPTALFWHISARDFDGYTDRVFVAQLGGIAGYQWVFNRKISLEPALGLSLTAVGAGSESILGGGVVPLFAIRVGYVIK